MNATPNPTMRAKLLEPEAVAHHRRLFCPEYDDCLEIAVAGGWTSWTCEHCPLAALPANPLRLRLLIMAVAASPGFDGEHSAAGLP